MSGAFKIVAIAGIAAATMLASSAQAADIVVKVGDLDLSSPQDAKVFEHRMDVAARQLCQTIQVIGTRLPPMTACRADVRAEAKEALDGGFPQFVAVVRTAPRPPG
ncbi:MAG TPA: UrcA family protein [Caulobacteraceae bacterium]|jgi:UrcA family protein|nr:UrcA family protein [Caulobacteraceae bacterium]